MTFLNIYIFCKSYIIFTIFVFYINDIKKNKGSFSRIYIRIEDDIGTTDFTNKISIKRGKNEREGEKDIYNNQYKYKYKHLAYSISF